MALPFRGVEFVTRGDGITGDDIFPHSKYISKVPQTIPETGITCIRGEIVMPLDNFKKYYKSKGVKNPRNLVSGLCKGRSSPKDLANMELVAYDYHGSLRNSEVVSESQALDLLEKYGFQVLVIREVLIYVRDAISIYEGYDASVGLSDELPYLTDGLVLQVNKFEDQEKFDLLGGRPGWAVAIKPTSKSVITKVIGLTWDNRKSAEGSFCPVAQVQPADLDGTTLRNVNLFNLDYLLRMYEKGFGIGAEILVVRTGDVLPYLKDVIVPAPNAFKYKQEHKDLPSCVNFDSLHNSDAETLEEYRISKEKGFVSWTRLYGRTEAIRLLGEKLDLFRKEQNTTLLDLAKERYDLKDYEGAFSYVEDLLGE